MLCVRTDGSSGIRDGGATLLPCCGTSGLHLPRFACFYHYLSPCRDITVPECCRTWDSACVSPLREMSLIWQKKRTELGAQGRAARASLLPSKPSGQPVRGPGRRCWIQRLHQSFHYGKAAWNPLGASPWNLRRPHALFGSELREVGLLKAAYFGIWCRTMQSLFCCKMPEIHASMHLRESWKSS